MGTESLPAELLDLYEVHEWKHACAVLREDFRAEWDDIVEVLSEFRLYRSHVAVGGGGLSKVSQLFNKAFVERGWREKAFETMMVVDEAQMETPTHKVDCVKGRIALEIEWNNKDPFYDRDLSNFRLLFELRAISVGVIITRCDELQDIFDALGKGRSYGGSTTHMSKLLPRLEGGGGGGCPVLVFGITKALYVED